MILNVLNPRRPLTTLEQACPTVREAFADYDRQVAAGDTDKAARAWKRMQDLAQAFREGAEYGAMTGRAI